MAEVKKHAAKRVNILFIRPRGGASTISISPFFLFIFFVFILIFTFVSIILINRYFLLYMEHNNLLKEHKAATADLHRLQSLYSYQLMVSDDYIKYVQEEEEKSQLIPINSPSLGETSEAKDLLEAWAAKFPDPSPDEAYALAIKEFSTKGGEFKFRLVTEAKKKARVQGFILMLFSVHYPGDKHLSLLPYPEFDINEREPDFISGNSFNMRSSQLVAAALPLKEGGKIIEMMLVAKSKEGKIIFKKKIRPAE